MSGVGNFFGYMKFTDVACQPTKKRARRLSRARFFSKGRKGPRWILVYIDQKTGGQSCFSVNPKGPEKPKGF